MVGSVIFQKHSHLEPPSIFAASYMEGSTFCRADKKMRICTPEYHRIIIMLPKSSPMDWDTFAGQVFTEWRDNPDGYDTHIYSHVINDFRIPADWTVYRGFDWGYSKPFSVTWIAVSKGDSRFYMVREWYGCTNEPNTGLKLTPQEIANGIREREQADPNLKGHQIIGIADPAIFARDGGESIAEMMEKCGVFFNPADHTRIAGKMQLHYRLAFDDNGIPMMYVFRSCKEFIRCFPSLVYDDTKVEDINTEQEDHNYDSTRYIAMEHPMNPIRRSNVVTRQYDPLSTENYMVQTDKFAFYRK